MPPNLFYGTGIPTCILVVKKCRVHAGEILFIDAIANFGKNTNQNYLRESDIAKIIDTYRGWKTEDKFSYAATMDEIRENEFNLNIPRYVDTFEPEPPVDLKAVTKQLADLERQMKSTDKTIAKFCKELGIPSPVGG